MVESARLESVYMLIAYRGFESLRHRQTLKKYSYFIEYQAVSDSIKNYIEPLQCLACKGFSIVSHVISNYHLLACKPKIMTVKLTVK